ncbi:hypothetical protein Pmani_020485 [Petrolisthes manimaculis]|uniref:Uncharacterized protein n=1 Tax=Petrolisthes manimaculis TaxID=1843537 RepID=A0AAE1U308_9EUCA|nr:hypothetical protein Pmani_020485 [Petrolisthes manimaculis]
MMIVEGVGKGEGNEARERSGVEGWERKSDGGRDGEVTQVVDGLKRGEGNVAKRGTEHTLREAYINIIPGHSQLTTTSYVSKAENESLTKEDEEIQEVDRDDTHVNTTLKTWDRKGNQPQDNEDNIRERQTKPENNTHKIQEHEDIKIDTKTQPQNKKTQRQADEPQAYNDYKTVYQTKLQNNVSKTQEHEDIKSDHRKCQNKTHRAPDHDNIKVDETEAKNNERQEHEPQRQHEDTQAEEAAGIESTTHERQRGHDPPHEYTYKETNVNLMLEDTGRHIITRRQTDDDNSNNHEALQMEEVDEDSPYCIYQDTILQCDYKDSNRGVTLVRQPRVNGSLSMVTLQHVHHLTLHPSSCYNLYLVAVGQAMVEEQVEGEQVEQMVGQKGEEIESEEDEEKEVMVVPVEGQKEEGFTDEGNEEMGKKYMIEEENVEDDEGNEKKEKEDLENQENKVQEKKKPKNMKNMVETNEDKFINEAENNNNELLTPPTCSCCPLLNLEDVTLNQTPRHVRDLHASTSNISRIHLKGIQNLFTLTETQVGSLRIQEQVQGHVRLRLHDVSLGRLEKLHLSTSSSVNCVKCVIENLPQGALRLSSRGNEFRDTSFGEHTGVIHLVGGAAGVVLENIQGRVSVQTSCSTLQKLPRQQPQRRRPCVREISPQPPPSPATKHNNCTVPLVHSSSPSSSSTPSRDTGEGCSRDLGLLVVMSLLAVSIVINVCQLLYNQPRKFLVSRLPWHLRGVGRRESLERELFLKGPQRHKWEQDSDLASLEASVGFYSDNPDADSYSISTNHDDEGETVFYEVELRSPAHGAQRKPQIIETPPTPTTQRRKYSDIAAKNDTADPLERQMTSLVGHVTETSPPSSSYIPESLREQRRQTCGQVRKRHHTVNNPLTVQRDTNPQQKNPHQTSATLSGHGKQDKSKEEETEEDLLGMNNVAPRKNNNNTRNHFSTPTRRRFQSYDGPYL